MKRLTWIAILIGWWGGTALAESDVSIELNSLMQTENACRMVFTAQSMSEVESLILETVLFDGDGSVILLTLFDFEALPSKKLRVRQFDIADIKCNNLGTLLFNGINTCVGPGCGNLLPSSRVESIGVLG
tara:strand:- start:57 stop:446 length:390 start_codon:yes stop_codon:yes gene_type:complete